MVSPTEDLVHPVVRDLHKFEFRRVIVPLQIKLYDVLIVINHFKHFPRCRHFNLSFLLSSRTYCFF